MKKEKGFTLIELLAVIVILAIIALIAVPIILNVIDDSKKGSLKSSAYGIIDAGEIYLAKEALKNESIASLNETLPNEKINYKGSQLEGQLVIEKGKTAILIKDSNHCAVKQLDEEEVKVYSRNDEKCKLKDVEIVSKDYIEPIDDCFDYYQGKGMVAIKGFKCYKENDYDLEKQYQYITIPQYINDDPVVSLDKEAFADKKLKGVKILYSLYYGIGDSVFINNQIEEIEISSQIENVGEISLGKDIFKNNPITKIRIVGDNCHSLDSVWEKIALPNIEPICIDN